MPIPSSRRNFLVQTLHGGLFAVLAVAPCLRLAAAVRVCTSCGHEALGTEAQCSHCKATLPALPDAAPAAPPPPPAAEEAKPDPAAAKQVPDAVIADQAATARRLFDEGSYWGSILFARNTAAMLALKGREGTAAGEALDPLIRECRKRLTTREQPCHVCKGTGARQMKALTLKGEVIDQTVVGGKCTVCKGTGRIPARALDDEIAREEARSLQAFVAEQKKRGLEETRGLWLPEGLYAALGPSEQSAMRKAAGTACARCWGFGSFACDSCNGAGVLACPNENCASGIEICPDCKGTGRTTGTRGATSVQSRCASCNSTGKRTCQECMGKGFLACETCQGHGEMLCKTCKGTGEAPLCTKCQGDGVIECARCSGSGTYKGMPCESCKGAGRFLCKSCNGAGRISRR